MSTPQGSVAVVGAGISGSAAVRTLAENGISVDCYEKSRGTGGRTSTRRIQDDDRHFHFDHGAQYFTIRSESFRKALEPLIKRGDIVEWNPRIGVFEDDTLAEKPPSDTRRWVAKPGMSSLADELIREEKPMVERRVTTIEAQEEHLRVKLENGQYQNYEHVILTAPPQQSAEIIDDCSPALASFCRTIQFEPIWAVLLGFEKPVAASLDAVFTNQGILDWVARNSSKPGRPDSESWVLHSTSGWAETNSNVDNQSVIDRLREEWLKILGLEDPPDTLYEGAHYWKYARAEEALDVRTKFDRELGLYLAGDWLAENRIEGAFRSGTSAAEAIISTRG
jgi:predicted NAD/FAD-dependent oxidoreductase